MTEDGLPILPHQAAEFYAWLWWSTEQKQAVFDLGGQVGRIELWVDDRIAFRHPSETKVTAIMTGENPSATMEARAAIAGGKVLQELRMHMRRDDRDFSFTLKGAQMDLAAVKLPQVVEGDDAAIYDRMHLYDELCFVIAALFRAYAADRAGTKWDGTILPYIRRWVLGVD